MNPFTVAQAPDDIGWFNLQPGPQFVDNDFEPDALACALTVQEMNAAGAVAQATLINQSDRPIRISGIRWTAPAGSVPAPVIHFPSAAQPGYFATENFRGEAWGAASNIGNAFFRPMPNETVLLGESEDRYFPGVFITSPTLERGLFCAAVSHNRFHLRMKLRGAFKKDAYWFEALEHPLGLSWIEIAPGEKVFGEKLYFGVVATNRPQTATAPYYDILRKEGMFDRLENGNPFTTQHIWCSWNYDFYHEVTEANVVSQLPVIKRHFPTVRFIQVDDGYQYKHPDGACAMIDFLYADPPHGGFDPVKFPSHPRDLASAIKAQGLRPAIWFGLWVPNGSPLVKEHPDWILRDRSGRPYRIDRDDALGKGESVLDPSVPGVQEYLRKVCRTVFGEWGYEGVKLDFCSFAFESGQALYRHPGRTGAQWRRWLVELFREYLPHDGFFGWCIACGTGNPLVGREGADYFRAAIDINNADWHRVRTIAQWMAATGLLMNQNALAPNVDSIGYASPGTKTAAKTQYNSRPDPTPTEWRSWLNLAICTGGLVEISGDLTRAGEETLKAMATALSFTDIRRELHHLDLPYGPFDQPPALWLARGAEEALLGVFNWTDAPQEVEIDFSDTRLRNYEGPWLEAWGEPLPELKGGKIILTLAPHESRLLQTRGR